MKTNLILKINFLALGLFVTVFAIYHLNSRGLSRPALEALGIPTAQSNSSQKISWCDTRVSALIKPNAFKIAQEENKWLVETDKKQELNFLSMEKWFGANCAVKANEITKATIATKATASERFLPVLLIKFVNGEVDALRRSPEGQYIWKDKAFRSQDLDQAIDRLQALTESAHTISQ